MSIAVSAGYVSQCSVTRTFSGEGIGSQNQIGVNGLNTSATLNAGSTPAASKDTAFTFALTAGAGTIDLTNITDPNLGTVSLSGITPNLVKLQNPATNANAITVKQGATNGYTGLGASFLVTIPPGGEVLLYAIGGSTVGAGSKTLDLTGTGTQALNVQIVAG